MDNEKSMLIRLTPNLGDMTMRIPWLCFRQPGVVKKTHVSVCPTCKGAGKLSAQPLSGALYRCDRCGGTGKITTDETICTVG